MPPEKQVFQRDVTRFIHELCILLYNLKSQQELDRVFGIPTEELDGIVARIVDQLPDDMFTQTNADTFIEIEKIFAKEFIFFQLQEKLTDPQYENDLSNFIRIFARDIKARFKILIKEE